MHLIPHIDPYIYDKFMKKCRQFFQSKNLVECYLSNRLSILAACEQPETVAVFDYIGQTWPHHQTEQMNLEDVILKEGKEVKNGFYHVSTSYREEKNPVIGRHSLIFNLLEIELPCDMEGLLLFQKEFLEYLGFGDKSSFVEVNYMDMCEKYGVTELTHEHEKLMGEEYGNVVFLKYFPEEESFWNMMRHKDGLTKKVDVLIGSDTVPCMETIGSAERSVDTKQMRESFLTVSGGGYAQLLYDKFGKERVDQELDDYLSLPMFTRSGMGIGVNRLLQSMISLKLI